VTRELKDGHVLYAIFIAPAWTPRRWRPPSGNDF
jgi:hypothetical protein